MIIDCILDFSGLRKDFVDSKGFSDYVLEVPYRVGYSYRLAVVKVQSYSAANDVYR